ncbi:polysaccharide biosynthesis C-terminal domain-containing protein [Paenibacillus sp. ACRRX]|uniref:polysaccharide biosynthesis C-terminal domain-containing protein n=1 Tax=Paenibacillus sp. ACRRX TaxID=2918206 RepID=UPI001EF4C781|nr:polysaccharide biosynthesis C-terminal domain-containing protein [Paenibacillus sp. ACRRX]MCG7406103.1 polysaccharide biosynthesis C-terminal domain-containing protein [Paenibacillus sp. ACRRX]
MKIDNALYNLIANLLLQFVTAAVGIILPRLIIEAYGSNMNGMISSINQFLRYLSLVEAGLGAASIAALYKPLAASNIGEVNAVLSASRLFYRRAGIIFAVLVVGCAVCYPFLVHGQVPVITSSVMVLILAGSGLVEYFIIGKYRVLLMADQKSYVISLIQTIGVILNAVVSVVLIMSGFDVLITQTAATLIFVSRVLLVKWYVRREYKEVNYRAVPNHKALDRRWDAFIHQLNTLIVYAAPVVIITICCSLSEVSVYAVYNMVFVAVNMFVSAFSNGLMASFGHVIASGERGSLLRQFGAYEYMYYAVLTAAYACAAILILPFLRLYTSGIHDAVYIRPELAALFIVVGIVSNVRLPHYTLIQAAGHFRETKYPSIVESIINLVVSIILVQWFGMIGVMLGSICSHLYRTPELIRYTSKHILEHSAKQTIVRIIRLVILSAIAITPFLFVFVPEPASVMNWLLWAIIAGTVVLFIIVIGNVLLEPETARQVWKQVNRAIKKLKQRKGKGQLDHDQTS